MLTSTAVVKATVSHLEAIGITKTRFASHIVHSFPSSLTGAVFTITTSAQLDATGIDSGVSLSEHTAHVRQHNYDADNMEWKDGR